VSTQVNNLSRLRMQAISNSLFSPLSLKAAINKLGFVQADPIRAPARAQDLILRQRVNGYRAGDLERKYESLDVEEDYLYAYGFLPRENWQLLHPRHAVGLSKDEKLLLKLAAQHGELHPRDLESHFGKERTVNAWGGYSKASTRLLEDLHYRGLLRISRRQDGIKIYSVAPETKQHLSPDDRLKSLVLLITRILMPIPESSLRSAIQHLAHAAPTLPERKSIVKSLLQSGELESIEVEGVRYISPAGTLPLDELPETVRFLAPFDPLVWDRRRFEYFWEWRYRFEAYTPPPKRKLGYYALPILWCDKIVGWANIAAENQRLQVNVGYVKGNPPRSRAFRLALQDEIDRFTHFLA
jgi:uncharacterized protein YcaQ